MKKLIMLLMAGLMLTGVAYAQQDPDDPGDQDSMIVVCVPNYVDSTNTYQPILVQVYAVTDDSMMYYNLPLRWIAPLGGFSPTGVNTQYQPPVSLWDVRFDTVRTTENYIRQFGIANMYVTSHNPPLLTNGNRTLMWALRFIVAPNTRSQIAYLDTTFDPVVGQTAFSDELGDIEITPGFSRGVLYIHPLGANDPVTQIPDEYALLQNYPNPFNPETNIEFNLPKEQDVYVSVFNLLGQQIRTLVNTRLEAGKHMTHWDGKNDNGVGVPSGVYFYRLYTSEFSQTNKMVLVR